MLYLLDTNIVSYLIKAKPPEVVARFNRTPPNEMGISAITAAELRYWICKRPEQPRIRSHIGEFLLRVQTLPWDASAAAAHGELKSRLFQIGRPLSEMDMQIAAHALALDCTLVTHDAAFRHVPDLRVEDWTIAS